MRSPERGVRCNGCGIGDRRRGAAYVLALVTLLVGATLALAMLRATVGYFKAEDSRRMKQAAVNLAEAGLEYGLWRIHYKNEQPPYTGDVDLDTGSFHVEITDDGNREPSTVLITSTGTCEGHSYTAKRVALGMLPYRYNWCENKEAREGNVLTSSGPGGGVRANDRIKLDNASSNISNGGWAAANIEGPGQVSPQHTFVPHIMFPDIDYSYYDSIATHTFYGDKVFSSLQTGTSAVVKVNGNVSVGIPYTGCITIVATGDITVYASVVPQSNNSYLALITEKKIYIQENAQRVEAIVYAHKSDKSADIDIQRANTVVVGSIASDDIHTSGPVTMTHNPNINLAVLRELHLPGL